METAQRCVVHNISAAFTQTLALTSQNIAVALSMGHIKPAPLGHFRKQLLKNTRKLQISLKSMECANLKRQVLIPDIMHGLHVLQGDSWGHEMGLEQSAIAHPGLPKRFIPLISLLLR